MTKIKKCKFTKIKMNKKVASIKTKKARANRDKMKKKTEGNQNLKNINLQQLKLNSYIRHNRKGQ